MDRRVLLSAMTLVLALSSLAEARKWTDTAGNEINAEYVRIHEGEVVLRQGTRVIKCPYDKFSDLDKAYLREQMEADHSKSKRRTGISQIGGPVVPEATDGDVHELRTWQDTQGRKILAQYAGFSAGRIELLKEGKRVSYPFTAFRPEDQIYVARILTSEGRADEIPKAKQEGGEERGPGVPSHGRGSHGRGGPMGSGHSGPESNHGVPRPPRGPNFAGPSHGGPNFAGPGHGVPNFHGPTAPTGPVHGGHPIHEPKYTSAPKPDSQGMRFDTSSMMEKVSICSSCNKEVPDHLGAGDHCPHCNVRFDYEEKADGTKEYASGFSWRRNRIVVRLAVLGFFVVMGALGALFRR